MRKYTVKDLDELENIARNKFIWGTYKPDPSDPFLKSRNFERKDLYSFVTMKMTVWIQAGIGPENF